MRGIPRQRSLNHDPAYSKDGIFIGDLLVGLRFVPPLIYEDANPDETPLIESKNEECNEVS